MIFLKISLHFCSQMSNWQYPDIGSDKGLVTSRRHAVIWINDGLVYSRIYVSLDVNESNNKTLPDDDICAHR